MPLLSDSELRQTLFSDLYDNELLDDMPQAPIQSWDVMDQFPPYTNDLVFQSLSSRDQALSLASRHQVHYEAGPSTALRKYVQNIVLYLILKMFLVPILKMSLLYLQPLTSLITITKCMCHSSHLNSSDSCHQCVTISWYFCHTWWPTAFTAWDILKW